MMPVMVASADVEGMTQSEISDYVENELSPVLESIDGVASVSTTGTVEDGTAKPLVVIPATFLGGAVFCMGCDLIARMAFAPLEL